MSLSQRLMLCAAFIGVGAASHFALVAHLAAGKEGEFASLRAELASFPEELRAGERTYRGIEHPGKAQLLKQVPFADEVLYRVYEPATPGGGAFLLYAAHSRTGEDRKHHPEVCLREAAGTPEDFAARKLVPLREDGSARAQRFRFRSDNGQMNLYYWHCTLPQQDAGRRSPLQTLHQQLNAAAPSVTFQAITYASGDDLERFEADALPAIDAALRAAILPDGCSVGSDRIPVTFLRR